MTDGCALQNGSGAHRPPARNWLFLRGLFDVLDDRVDFLYERFVAVTNAVQVGADAGYGLDGKTGFVGLLVIEPKQRKLRLVKGYSILTVIGRRCSKAYQRLIARRKSCIAEIKR